MPHASQTLAKFVHAHMLKSDVKGVPAQPDEKLGDALVKILQKYGTQDLEDLCQDFALKLIAHDYLRGMSYSQARQYLNCTAMTLGVCDTRAHYRASKVTPPCQPQPPAIDEELTPAEIGKFVDSLTKIHPKAPEYVERVIDGDTDKGLTMGGFFTKEAVSTNYWTRYKATIRAKFAKFERM